MTEKEIASSERCHKGQNPFFAQCLISHDEFVRSFYLFSRDNGKRNKGSNQQIAFYVSLFFLSHSFPWDIVCFQLLLFLPPSIEHSASRSICLKKRHKRKEFSSSLSLFSHSVFKPMSKATSQFPIYFRLSISCSFTDP